MTWLSRRALILTASAPPTRRLLSQMIHIGWKAREYFFVSEIYPFILVGPKIILLCGLFKFLPAVEHMQYFLALSLNIFLSESAVAISECPSTMRWLFIGSSLPISDIKSNSGQCCIWRIFFCLHQRHYESVPRSKSGVRFWSFF